MCERVYKVCAPIAPSVALGIFPIFEIVVFGGEDFVESAVRHQKINFLVRQPAAPNAALIYTDIDIEAKRLSVRDLVGLNKSIALEGQVPPTGCSPGRTRQGAGTVHRPKPSRQKRGRLQAEPRDGYGYCTAAQHTEPILQP